MNNFKLTVGIEPTDKYGKAKTDLLQALKSCRELNPQERESLLNELFGAANVVVLDSILNRIIGKVR